MEPIPNTSWIALFISFVIIAVGYLWFLLFPYNNSIVVTLCAISMMFMAYSILTTR